MRVSRLSSEDIRESHYPTGLPFLSDFAIWQTSFPTFSIIVGEEAYLAGIDVNLYGPARVFLYRYTLQCSKDQGFPFPSDVGNEDDHLYVGSTNVGFRRNRRVYARTL